MSIEEKLAAARAHHAAGRFAEAEQLYRAALDLDHRNVAALRGLAFLCHQLGRYDVAVRWLVLLVETVPNDAGVWSNLATTHAILGDVDAAMVCYQRSLMLDPNHAGYHYNLATLLKDTGRLDEAIEEYRESLRLDPIGNPQAWNSLLYLIHFHPDYDPPRIYREHLHWAQQNADRLNFAIEPYGNDRSPDRKLRIGYVSSLLRHHGMTFFLLGLLQNHDRERFEITCYSGTRRPDGETKLYCEAADRWRDTAGVSHVDLAQQIRRDEIDILVDLNLHMADDRMEVFARKPAPVQVTYLGYPSTTGVKEIDWRITDAYLDPPGENDAFYVEKSYRLPWNFCYRPMRATPEVNALPAQSTGGRITFGCLNNLAKVTPQGLALWSSVLRRTPGSRLILMAAVGTTRKRLSDHFAKDGVDADRIEFVDFLPHWDYLSLYHRIDVALDTWPCPGHSTTCDALWMGVPVVTLPAKTAISRGGVSILNAVGLPELIATSAEDYGDRVTSLLQDLEGLAKLRAELRGRVQSSPLSDAKRFARDFEAAYRDVWKQWVERG